MRFEPDPKVAEVADAYALDMVDLARAQYHVDLDYSIASVDELERIAERLASHKPLFARLRPGFAAKVDGFSKGLGFYLAETMRRSWGAEHGWAIADDESRIYAIKLGDRDRVLARWPRPEAAARGGREQPAGLRRRPRLEPSRE